jgi:hypothetical protein
LKRTLQKEPDRGKTFLHNCPELALKLERIPSQYVVTKVLANKEGGMLHCLLPERNRPHFLLISDEQSHEAIQIIVRKYPHFHLL